MQSAHPGGAAFSGSEFLFLPSKTHGSLSPGALPVPQAPPCPPGLPCPGHSPVPWVGAPLPWVLPFPPALPCPRCFPVPWALVVTRSDAADAGGDFCLGFQGLRDSVPSQEAAPRPSFPGETGLQEGWVLARLHDPRCAGEAVPPRLTVPSTQMHK